MGGHNKGKLNQLQRSLPEGLVVDASWLERHGVSRQLRRKYVMNGWLLSLARGVYRRPAPFDNNEPLSWQQFLISLNTLLELPYQSGTGPRLNSRVSATTSRRAVCVRFISTPIGTRR